MINSPERIKHGTAGLKRVNPSESKANRQTNYMVTNYQKYAGVCAFMK